MRSVKRNWDGALADLDKAIRLDAKSAAAYRGRSELEICIGDLDAAMVDFDFSVKLESKKAAFSIWCMLATASTGTRPGERFLTFKTQRVSSPTTRNSLGSSEYWKLKGDFDRALAELDEAIRRDHAATVAYESRRITAQRESATWHSRMGPRDQARPGDPELLRARGALWSTLEDPDKAIADYSRAIDLDPGTVDTYLSRAGAWSQMNQHDKAIADISQAIKLDSKCAEAFLARGKERRAKGDLDQAIADYTEVIRLGTKSSRLP